MLGFYYCLCCAVRNPTPVSGSSSLARFLWSFSLFFLLRYRGPDWIYVDVHVYAYDLCTYVPPLRTGISYRDMFVFLQLSLSSSRTRVCSGSGARVHVAPGLWLRPSPPSGILIPASCADCGSFPLPYWVPRL